MSAVGASDSFLTVIIPAYNEVRTIELLLRKVIASPVASQIIVVDDGSNDGTSEVLDGLRFGELAGNSDIVFLRHDVNRGKGRAIRTGLVHAVGRFTLVQDADLEFDPMEYGKLCRPLKEGTASIVYGARIEQRPAAGGRFLLRTGIRFLNLMVRSLYGVRITDEATGYKVLPTELLRALDLQCEGFEFCPEVTAKVCRLGLAIAEVPIGYRPRTCAEGKKLRLSDGFEAIYTLWKLRNWNPADQGRVLRSLEPAICSASSKLAESPAEVT